jgi:hypothetical protein
MLGRTVQELRATMILPEYLSWQGYFRHKAKQADKPAPSRALGDLDPGELARALGGD